MHRSRGVKASQIPGMAAVHILCTSAKINYNSGLPCADVGIQMPPRSHSHIRGLYKKRAALDAAAVSGGAGHKGA